MSCCGTRSATTTSRGRRTGPACRSRPVAVESQGTSPHGALKRLYELAKKRLAAGQLLEMNLPDTPTTNPWQAFAGIWKDHPEFDAFLENIAKYRRSVNRANASR